MTENIVGVQPLIDITALTLQTAFATDKVDGYRPASLLFIAKPESGKTTTISKFSLQPYVYFTNEITVKILVDQILKQIETRQKRFILIPDILNCVKKSAYTREPLLQTLKTLVDEGVTNIQTPYKQYQFPTAIKAGLISAITGSDLYAKQGRYSLYNDLQRMGFLSRMIPFSYQYPIEKFVKIFHYIESGCVDEAEPVKIPKIVKREKQFHPDPNLFRDLENISRKLAQFSDSYGFRVQKNLQKLCYANAMLNGRNAVNIEDVQKVLHLGNWMNFDFNAL
jgi:hypothetical protein